MGLLEDPKLLMQFRRLVGRDRRLVWRRLVPLCRCRCVGVRFPCLLRQSPHSFIFLMRRQKTPLLRWQLRANVGTPGEGPQPLGMLVMCRQRLLQQFWLQLRLLRIKWIRNLRCRSALLLPPAF